MTDLDFGGLDIGGTLFFSEFDSDGLNYDAEIGGIDTEYLSLIVERTEDGVHIIAMDPRGTSEGYVYDGETPIKGIDYFTPEDVEEIEDTVVERIRVTYTHNQLSASDLWNISHNLGKFPSVVVVDSGGSTVMGEVTYIDANNLTVGFTYPFSGKAYLN